MAAACYPGGTLDSPDTVGYDWARNTMSSLFGARALKGEPNPARYAAVPGMLLLCTSLAVIFWRYSRRCESRVERLVIEIGGIGTTVYVFIIATPMHDAMIGVALAFALPTLAAMLVVLGREGRWGLVGSELACLALTLLGRQTSTGASSSPGWRWRRK